MFNFICLILCIYVYICIEFVTFIGIYIPILFWYHFMLKCSSVKISVVSFVYIVSSIVSSIVSRFCVEIF